MDNPTDELDISEIFAGGDLRKQEMTNYLQNLPVEVLLCIFSFIESEYLISSVRFVCKRFNSVLMVDGFWKKRLKDFINGHNYYQILSAFGLYTPRKWRCGLYVSWRDVCYQTEKEALTWGEKTYSMKTFTLSKPHFASIDAVKLLDKGRLCVSGGRDRTLALWNVEKSTPSLLESNGCLHQGWIWDVKSDCNDSFYSADWNATVVKWSIAEGLRPTCEYFVEKPALCLSVDPHYVTVGLQTSQICFLDPRIGSESNTHTIRVHRSAVMGVMNVDNHVVSISEDRTMSVTDIRKMEVIMNCNLASGYAIPVSLSKIKNLIYIANTVGQIHCIDTNNNYSSLETFTAPHDRLTSIWAGLGCLIVGSRSHHLSFLTPTQPVIIQNDMNLEAEIAKIDYVNGILAIARSDNRVSIFKN